MDTKALSQKILDLAISSKLVPQDPNDEPASVLLERIRAEKQQMVKDGKLKAKDIKNDTVIFLDDDNLHYEKFPDGTVKCIEDEIPFELPEGWEWTRIFSVSFNLPYGTAKKSDSNGKVAVLRMGNLQNGEIDYSDLVYSSDDEDINQYELLENDLLFNRTNSAEWVGKTAIYRGGVKAIYAGYLIRLRTGLNAEYLNAVMNSQYERDYCNMVKTDGVNQSNINAQKLGAFLIPVPSLSEQCRIVCKFNNLLSFIETIESDKTDLQTTIQLTKSKILDLAIRGKLVPQNPDDEPASVLLDRIRAEKEELIKQGKIKRDKKESVIYKGDDNSYYEKIGDTVTCIDEELPFDIPENWAWVRLSSACIINPKNSIADDTVVSFVPMTLIQDGYANEFTFEQRKWGDVKKGFTHFAENDVGFAKITPCFENRKSVVFRGLCNGYGAGTTELYILRTFPDTIMPEYILYIVKTESFLVGGKQTCAGVVGQQRISKDYVCDYLVPVPPLNEQGRIINKCTEIMTMLHNIEKSLS